MVSKLGKKLYFLMLLLIIGACFVGGYEALATTENQTPVTFPDPNLETAIRKALYKPIGAIYTSELESLTKLNASSDDISDLTGLEYCTGLTDLKLSQNQINNISPLGGLTNLEVLYLRYNQISDISPLAGLTNLGVLYLNTNQISDISPLDGLTNLRDLYLWENQISDISALAGLTNLLRLNLDTNQISDISPLVENSGLSAGDEVQLANNPLSTDSRNVYIPQLEQRGVQVSWFAFPMLVLTGEIFPDPDLETAIRKALNKPAGVIYKDDLESLTKLGAAYITLLTGLEYCTSLIELHIVGNEISDLSPLGGLTNLRELSLWRNQISNISPLAGLTNLQKLILETNQISDISPLAGLISLEVLNLGGNQISDISPLAGLPALHSVYLTNNPLSAASEYIYIPLLVIKGVRVRPNSPPIILNTIMFIALALVAIRISITKRRMASWGLVRRALQLSLITIVCGLACYLACTGSLHYAAFPISFLLVSFGAVVTFWSFRGRAGDLVALALIALAPISFFGTIELIRQFGEEGAIWGPLSTPILAAAGVLFLLRRDRLRVAIIVPVVVLLGGAGLAFLLLFRYWPWAN